MTKIIDLGGQTIARHHVPQAMLAQYDQASAALSEAQASIRSSIKLIALQAPAAFSGTIGCTAPGQSGTAYNLGEVGGALMVNEKDVATFTKLGFIPVASVQPQSNLRAGIVFFDEPANEYLRYDGSKWAPVTLT